MSTPAEVTEPSKTDRVIASLIRFRPGVSVQILADDTNEHAFLKLWALARLLAWAVLDQRPGKRRSKGRANELAPRHTIHTRIAKRVGHLTIASLLDREDVEPNDNTFQLMLTLFMKTGGFGLLVKG